MQCCGYFNTTDLVEIGGFCADQTFVDTTVNSTGAFCVGPITNFADMTMNNIFRYDFVYYTVICYLVTNGIFLQHRKQPPLLAKQCYLASDSRSLTGLRLYGHPHLPIPCLAVRYQQGSYSLRPLPACPLVTLTARSKQRIEEQRFRKIDEKRGGRGFV